MNKSEALRLALEALEMSRRFVYADNRPQCDEAIDALRAALAQQAEPVQEPVAWMIDYEDGEREVRFVAGTRGITQTPLYAAAPTAKPVAWMTDRKEMYFDKDDALRYSDSIIQPLYLAPPQRKPLTEEKIDAEWRELDGEVLTMFMRVLRKFARAIERAHGIGEQP